MRVWVYPEKTHEELGAERWEVEWYEVPSNWALLTDEQREEYDYDRMPCMYKTFRGPGAEKKAQKFAKKMASHRANAYGCATVTRQVVDWYVEEDRVAEWANVGNPESYP